MKIQRKSKPEDIDAITFDELVEHGRASGANIVNGMPWSFHYKETAVTHENDDCYIVGGELFLRGDMLVSHGGQQPVPFSRAEFEEEYEPLPTQGAQRITAERQRQVAKEGWTPEHDDGHDAGELAIAGMCYAAYAGNLLHPNTQGDGDWRDTPPEWWMWGAEWWKPSDDPARNLEKAGALMAAEIDRLERAKQRNENDQRTNEGGKHD
jgi:hypothetical protein